MFVGFFIRAVYVLLYKVVRTIRIGRRWVDVIDTHIHACKKAVILYKQIS